MLCSHDGPSNTEDTLDNSNNNRFRPVMLILLGPREDNGCGLPYNTSHLRGVLEVSPGLYVKVGRTA